MPKQKDLKRIVRTRMQKTGESYTAARLHVVQKKPDYAALSGMSEASIRKGSGRSWAEWVALLDAWGAKEQPHRAIAEYVHSLGVADWWTQSVTVGYERIRGLRAIGQRRGGTFEASKSRTFAVPVATLFAAWSDARKRRRWLPGVTVRSQSANKAMRLALDDGTVVIVGFYAKGESKSSVAVQHTKLPSKAEADARKVFWGERFEELKEVLG